MVCSIDYFSLYHYQQLFSTPKIFHFSYYFSLHPGAQLHRKNILKIMTRTTRFFNFDCPPPPTTNFLIEFCYPAYIEPYILIMSGYLFISLIRFCPECKNDTSEVVRAGEKLKDSKKKSKMASATSTSNRDWGKVGTSYSSSKVHLLRIKMEK